ncbi:MAG: hypothetical protein OXN17_15440 [Candidatus Poribacteria bacterium]|nr:hypothetical protein [Candidatus Poribacteria bacterium]MDE0504291.1 hypothetical protein [Candidatus Poribacteria bacterium]
MALRTTNHCAQVTGLQRLPLTGLSGYDIRLNTVRTVQDTAKPWRHGLRRTARTYDHQFQCGSRCVTCGCEVDECHRGQPT